MPDGQMRPVDRSGLARKIVLAQSEGPYLLGGMKIGFWKIIDGQHNLIANQINLQDLVDRLAVFLQAL